MISNQTTTVSKFLEVMKFESKFIPGIDTNLLTETGAEELLGYVTQVFEIGFLALVPRVYNTRYGLTEDAKTLESVSAHTLLLEALVDRFLLFEYGPDFIRTNDGISYREIMEAARRHDLPELIIGDQPDNGNRDNKGLAKKEHQYWRIFSNLPLKHETEGKKAESEKVESEERINYLLRDMQARYSLIGRTLFIADKIALIIMALCCDMKDISPTMQLSYTDVSDNERLDMQNCDYCDKNGRFLGSEMWTVDYFKTRELYKYDDLGFFTAFIVMATLAAHNNHWYHWRKKDYTLLPK